MEEKTKKGRKMAFSSFLFTFCYKRVPGLRRSLTGDEMIGRPGTAHHHLNSRQMSRCHLIPILVFMHLFMVNQVGDIYQHSAGIDFAATNILVERRKDFVDLNGKGAGFG